ncbi:MAG TPA: hypothetical protein VI306_22310 [Pyrinomonadaceae bacterium]
MPFDSTATPPATDSVVTVRFTGLMLLKRNSDNGCDIGVHYDAENHAFEAMLIVSEPERPPGLVRLFSGRPDQPFMINVIPTPEKGVQVFKTKGFNRSSLNDHRDFGWAINLRKAYDRTLYFNYRAHPIATLNGGVLYTSRLSPELLDATLIRGGHMTRLHRFSADLSAAVELPTGGAVELSWNESSLSRPIRLPRLSDARGTKYTIVLINNPPSYYATSHDELSLYSSVLYSAPPPFYGVSELAQLSFIGDPSTDEVPCMPVILD